MRHSSKCLNSKSSKLLTPRALEYGQIFISFKAFISFLRLEGGEPFMTISRRLGYYKYLRKTVRTSGFAARYPFCLAFSFTTCEVLNVKLIGLPWWSSG